MDKIKTFFGILITIIPAIIFILTIGIIFITSFVTRGVLWIFGLNKHMLN